VSLDTFSAAQQELACQKTESFAIFAPTHHKNLKTQSAKILQEYNFQWSLQAHQLSLRLDTIRLQIAIFCDVWHKMTQLFN
jgi:hypothetical protein